MSFLSLRQLSKRYDRSPKACVDGIDLEMDEGQIVVLLGPSGCGKTTMLKMIAGLLTPTGGDILLGGRSILSIPAEKRDISMVFQKPLLFPHMTVGQNIGFGLKMRGVKQKTMDQKVEGMLDLVKLKGYGDRKASQLSGGQEQRVALARALIIEPKLLLLDEPLSALDPELRLEMRELILRVKEKMDISVLFVTHDQQEAVMLADKIALIMDGKVVQYDEASAFYTRPRTRRVAEFFGWTNFVPAIQSGSKISCSLGEFELDGIGPHNGPTCLTVRPEGVVLSDMDGGVPAIVRRVVYMGTKVDYEVECLGSRLGISLDTDHMYKKGQELFVRLLPNKVWAVRCDDKNVCDNRVVWGTAISSRPSENRYIEEKNELIDDQLVGIKDPAVRPKA